VKYHKICTRNKIHLIRREYRKASNIRLNPAQTDVSCRLIEACIMHQSMPQNARGITTTISQHKRDPVTMISSQMFSNSLSRFRLLLVRSSEILCRLFQNLFHGVLVPELYFKDN